MIADRPAVLGAHGVGYLAADVGQVALLAQLGPALLEFGAPQLDFMAKANRFPDQAVALLHQAYGGGSPFFGIADGLVAQVPKLLDPPPQALAVIAHRTRSQISLLVR